jgi:hypothetical protein
MRNDRTVLEQYSLEIDRLNKAVREKSEEIQTINEKLKHL